MRILDMFLLSKGLINSSQRLTRDQQPSFPASKRTKILGTLVGTSGSYVNTLASPQDEHEIGDMGGPHIII